MSEALDRADTYACQREAAAQARINHLAKRCETAEARLDEVHALAEQLRDAIGLGKPLYEVRRISKLMLDATRGLGS